MLYCSQVTAGEGHSWKGSVVSDTVKRGCSSIPMVSVQRQNAHCQPNNGKANIFIFTTTSVQNLIMFLIISLVYPHIVPAARISNDQHVVVLEAYMQ